ncbi:MAG: polyphosphate kinase 1, partial [Lentisphaeria bacterium]|nr:polyphosphate kinase 1 [Lentisphaeria bacterium]
LRCIRELPPQCSKQLKRYFINEIMPVLTPLAVDSAHPFPLLNSGALEIALALKRSTSEEIVHAFVEVPEVLPRFVSLPEVAESEADSNDGKVELLLLEELISEHIMELFPGCELVDKLFFRITRDMDFSVEEEMMDDLLKTIRGKLLQRRQRAPIRLEVSGDKLHSELGEFLVDSLGISGEFCYSLPGPLHLKQFFALVSAANRPELLEEPWQPVMPAVFREFPSVMDAIREKENILLPVPYCSFTPVVQLLEQAAVDPDVLAIKQTLYRVSGNSPIIKALQRAAENGKQVTVLLELKARFDESNNIAWAELLDRSGAHVVYGIAGLKVHCKALMVVRREEGHIRRYVHLGTGNYNDKTASLYTDMGLFSCDPDLCFDVANLFNLLSGCSAPPERWNMLAVAPFDLRQKFEALVEREIAHAKAGNKGRIIAKMNSFADEKMVKLIHRAADAGVEIDLIVRGVCCYRPHPRQENVRIYSIVDRFLEHTRAFYFENLGNSEYYLASADWMSRNMDRRIETMFPVHDPELCAMIRETLEFQLQDDDKKRRLLPTGCYTRPKTLAYSGKRSQARSYSYFKKRAEQELNGPGENLKVFTSKA